MSSRLTRYTSSPDQTIFFEEHIIALPLAPDPQDGVQQGACDRDDRTGAALALLVALEQPSEKPVGVAGDPGVLDDQPPDQLVARPRHSPVPHRLPRLMRPGDEPDVTGQVLAVFEPARIPKLQHQQGGREESHSRN